MSSRGIGLVGRARVHACQVMGLVFCTYCHGDAIHQLTKKSGVDPYRACAGSFAEFQNGSRISSTPHVFHVERSIENESPVALSWDARLLAYEQA